jgi:hypothetical protein
MSYLSRRIRSYFFWGLTFCLVLWHDAQPERIEREVQRAQLEIDDARARIASGLYVHEELCRDGWATPSSGSGRCSWHGGVDHQYSAERSAAFRAANIDINRFRKGQESTVTSTTVLWAALIFLAAPLLDLVILRRTGLYPDSFSSGDGPPTPQSERPEITTAPVEPQIKKISDSNACPICGSRMVVRVAGRGKNRGKSFFGCSRFPMCRGTRPGPNSNVRRAMGS